MCYFIPSLKSLEWRNRGPVATFQSRQVSRNSTKRWSGLKWAVRPRGCTPCRLCQRGLLSGVNTSQSLLRGIQLGFTRALLKALKTTPWPKQGLTRHHLSANSEHSAGLTRWKTSSISGESRSTKNWGLCGQGSMPGSQPDNTLMSSEVVLGCLWLIFCSSFDSAKQPCFCCGAMRRCECVYTSVGLKVLPLLLMMMTTWHRSRTYSFIPGTMTNRYVILTLPRHCIHSDTTTLTTSICWFWRLRLCYTYILAYLHMEISLF